MSVNVVEKIDDLVKVRQVLVSVSDKAGLEEFVPELLKINPEVQFLSTGGTFGRISEILGSDASSHLTQVSEYTGQPETQGGLVKTLDFKVYLGLLTETYNASHQGDLSRTGAVAIDMVVVNLYPFQETVAREGVTVEQARSNIDIGGPCMIRASAKNYLRVAPVVNPSDYSLVLDVLKANDGHTTLDLRYGMARKAFEHTAVYDRAISDFLHSRALPEVASCYNTKGE